MAAKVRFLGRHVGLARPPFCPARNGTGSAKVPLSPRPPWAKKANPGQKPKIENPSPEKLWGPRNGAQVARGRPDSLSSGRFETGFGPLKRGQAGKCLVWENPGPRKENQRPPSCKSGGPAFFWTGGKKFCAGAVVLARFWVP